VDGIVKFWDLRQTGSGATAEAAPGLQLARLCDASAPYISQKQHGITSLSLHPQGTAAACFCPRRQPCLAAHLARPVRRPDAARCTPSPRSCHVQAASCWSA
jgi:hypothetical protein